MRKCLWVRINNQNNLSEQKLTGFIKKIINYFLRIAMIGLIWNLSLTWRWARALKSEHTYLVHFILSVKVSHAECLYSVQTMKSFKSTILKVKGWYSTWSTWQTLLEHNSQYKNANSFWDNQEEKQLNMSL